MSDEDFLPILNVDALLHPTKLTLADAEEFEKFEPYGMGNPKPILACKKVRGAQTRAIGKKENHLSFLISAESNGGQNIRAVAWDAANFAPMVENEFFDLAYEPEIDEWQGTKKIQCLVNYLAPTAGTFPSREILTVVYKFLKILRSKTDKFEVYDFIKKFNSATKQTHSTYAILSAIDIFRELGFIKINADTETFDLPTFGKKLDLKNSRTFRLGQKK